MPVFYTRIPAAYKTKNGCHARLNKVVTRPPLSRVDAAVSTVAIFQAIIQAEDMRIQALVVVLLLGYVCAEGVGADEVDFNRDIRPILSDRCYFCHGPDAENRQADLRLDDPVAARDVIESGTLLGRITDDDPALRMPPPESNLSLTKEEIELIREWIGEGAKYENHWSFEPLPKSVPVPQDPDEDWSRHDLDRFVWRAAKKQGHRPSKEAPPLRWLRRVTYDLTGLPPSHEEIEVFNRELTSLGQEAAYGAAVDRLLASPAYGEHMAVSWLDAARYADSYGYQSDLLNTQWPYRDWVVRAFNDNLPYDEFLTWQLAGDLLPSPTREQRLATAFNRTHRLNNEGGAVFEEWRIENVADRVQTFGTAVLGLTLECSRCHDHKYDPISMRDYYSLGAFFNSIDENGVYDVANKVPAPSLLLPTDQQAAELADAHRALLEAESAYNEARAEAERRFGQWKPTSESLMQTPDLIRSLSLDAPYKNDLKEIYYPASGDAYAAGALPLVNVPDIPFPRLPNTLSDDGLPRAADLAAPPRRAIKLDGEHGIVLPGIEPFDRWTPFSIVVTLKQTAPAPAPSVVAQASYGQLAFNGWDVIIDRGRAAFRMYQDWPGNAIAVRTTDPLPLNEWIQISASYDGSSQASGLKLFLNGEELETEIVRDQIKKRASVEGHHGGKLTIGQRFRDRGFAGGLVDDVRVFGRSLTAEEIMHLATGKPVQPTAAFYVSAIDKQARAALEQLTGARKRFVMAEQAILDIPVMEEMSEPRETHVLARGAYDAPRSDETLVTRATFEKLAPEFPDDLPRDRLGLARWTTLADHPLTGRVIVNRLWRNFFGAGLVHTPENFGLQGELPTHPQLLDWLARDFVTSGWDVKRFCRNVALSATYRQDSRGAAELVEADPENRLLARGPAHRLSAEQIRDTALYASGKLNSTRGGPPVSPYQPGDDLWRESNSMSPAYQQSLGKDLYRRSLYSVWKRTAPLPNMVAFDAESREVCIMKRARTNTPLQALVLMNDVQFVEAARLLAEKSLKLELDPETQIAWAFRSLTGRAPTDHESKVLSTLRAAEQRHYAAEPAAAEKLVGQGDSKPAGQLDPVELAAMTVVCQTILNLDATIWKR